MKRESSWLMAVVSLVVGIVLIIFHSHTNLMTWIVESIGLLIVVPAVWLLLVNLFGSKERRNYLVAFAAFIALIAGVWVCCDPVTFASFIAYIFAAVLIISGIWHIATLSVMGSTINVPIAFYVIPALLIIAALAFIFTALKMMTGTLVLVMGIALIASAVNVVIELIHRVTAHPVTSKNS